MKNSAQVTDFLLAGRKLKSHSIVSLLLSSSFGLNAIFYAAWLGYAIGMWALLIQAAWSISFFLLIPASKQFTNIASLHDFLGQQFGSKTKLLSALCSIVGIMYFVAWEVSIKVSTCLLYTSKSPPTYNVNWGVRQFELELGTPLVVDGYLFELRSIQLFGKPSVTLQVSKQESD